MQQLRYCPHCHCHVTPKRIIFAELISSDLARGFALMGIIVGLFRGGALAGIAQRLRIPTEVLQHCCHFASREYSSWLIEHPHGLYNLARHFNATLAAA
jgi:hypothetical protein